MTPPMMKFSFIFELLSAGIGLNMDGVVVISILLELNKNAPSSVLMAERSIIAVVQLRLVFVRTCYVKERHSPSTNTQ